MGPEEGVSDSDLMDLNIKLQPKQLDLLNLLEGEDPATWLGIGGARGGAKSHGGRNAMILRRFRHSGTRMLIIRRKKKELVENHIEPLWRQFPFMRAWWNQQENTLRLPNKSAIVFGYAEHPAHDQQGDIYDLQGSEWADILVDEATHFNEEELTFLKTCCRWPNDLNYRPKMVLLMNPGGIGHSFVKRVMIDRRYQGEEKPEDYRFIQAYGWDNIEWVRQALTDDGVLDQATTYYDQWSEEQRFHYFVTRSDYGKNLNSLKGKSRSSYLMGDWDAFTGQFFDVWDDRLHVIPPPAIDKWIKRWVSIDWGFEHNSAVYWHAQVGPRTITYRELVQDKLSPQALAQAIIDRTPTTEEIEAVYLSWDAFSARWKKSEDTIERLLSKSLRVDQRFPGSCTIADNDRVGGWMLMYQMLENETWAVSSDCEKLIECIPDLNRNPDKAEDVLKVDGDDPADSARYGLKSRLSPGMKPVEMRVEERIHTTDPTSRAIWISKFIQEEKQRCAPVRFGFGRRGRGGIGRRVA